jgi:hypothetical protein
MPILGGAGCLSRASAIRKISYQNEIFPAEYLLQIDGSGLLSFYLSRATVLTAQFAGKYVINELRFRTFCQGAGDLRSPDCN